MLVLYMIIFFFSITLIVVIFGHYAKCGNYNDTVMI